MTTVMDYISQLFGGVQQLEPQHSVEDTGCFEDDTHTSKHLNKRSNPCVCEHLVATGTFPLQTVGPVSTRFR